MNNVHDDSNEMYKIIENYRSILDRKQTFISSWKVRCSEEKVIFVHGYRIRKHTDALVIRLKSMCFINPWYKYINIKKDILSILKQNSYDRILEIILLECHCLTNCHHQYEIAFIQCPCLNQLKTYCAYCRMLLDMTNHSSILQCNRMQQKNISLSFSFSSNDINDNCYSLPGPAVYQRTVQIQAQFKNNRYDTMKEVSAGESFEVYMCNEKVIPCQDEHISRSNITSHWSTSNISTQSEANSSKVVSKTPNQYSTEVQQINEHMTNVPQMYSSLSILPLDSKIQLVKKSLSENRLFNSQIWMQANFQINNHSKHDFQINSGAITESQRNISMSLPLTCMDTCETIDAAECNRSVCSLVDRHDIIRRNTCRQHPQAYFSIHHNGSNSKAYRRSLSICRLSKLYYLNTNSYRIRRQHQVNKHFETFFKQGYSRQTQHDEYLKIVEQSSSSYSSSTMDNSNDKQLSNSPLTTESNTTKHNLSINKQQKSITNLESNTLTKIDQYKISDHIILARASKNSIACQRLQMLLSNHETYLEELIDLQLLFTCNNDYRSICILIDDYKQSEQYRSTFLHYTYTTLSNTLKKFVNIHSIRLSCMNLAFFNNSLCDIVHMQRLRLIDTGRQILLLPSCEIVLNTLDDITTAMNRLSTTMSFAHQLLIINFHNTKSSLSGSFLFLQLAPICSLQSKGLLTNLNSTTYSVLNLIRQLNNGTLFNHNRAKRYLLNDYCLNRLLKSYIFSSKQIMTVLTIKSQVEQRRKRSK